MSLGDRRYGKIRVSRFILRNNPEFMPVIFRWFTPLKTEEVFNFDAIEYTGYSKFFPKIEPGTIVPEYDIVVDLSDPTGITWFRDGDKVLCYQTSQPI